MRVDHALVLSRLDPLGQGSVTGRQQTLHLPDAKVTVIAELSQSIVAEHYHGVRVRIVSLDHGPLDANWFGFTEHDTFTGAEKSLAHSGRAQAIDSYNQDRAFQPGRFHPEQLRAAVRTYITACTGIDPTPGCAPNRRNGQDRAAAPGARPVAKSAARPRR
ncbi:hypothetical protein [Streptacidiphilus fuscans]|uniref:Uncharacterized protein n=1 Tax=Streptacidiphilus fuscans TaxID=2789292 RepID=A0A931FFN4_9ACTN|nr:hypothetical protein [Streptacidiphilus fuscans]MBF9071793.1 hypothetical protein [Streptacidiphilus fuscans]